LKGKLPFKCFECGRVRHYASKFPCGKINDTGDEVKFTSNDHKRRQNIKKIHLYSKEDNDCESNEIMSNDERGEILFIATRNQNIEEIEVEVDFEREPITALE